MKIAIIILNYKNVADTLSCVASIKNTNQLPAEIIVVDNASQDGSVEKLQQKLGTDITLIEASENGGYAAGNNLGLKYAFDEGFDYFLILNNDTLVTAEMTQKLFTYLKKHPETGIVGPGICTYEDSNILESAGSLMNLNSGKINRLYTGKNKETVKDKVIPCDYVGGACMAFPRQTIEKIGYIPEDYFLFFEENEWCQKAKESGLGVVCLGNALVIHKGSATINQFTGLSEYYTYKNLVLFIKRNGTWKNKLYFYPYIIGFALKAGFTKENGWRFMRYVRDGFLNQDTYRKKEAL